MPRFFTRKVLVLTLTGCIAIFLLALSVSDRVQVVETGKWAGKWFASSVGMSVEVPENPINQLAQQLSDRERELEQREDELETREATLLEREREDRTLLFLIAGVGMGLILLLVLLNFYFDFRWRKKKSA